MAKLIKQQENLVAEMLNLAQKAKQVKKNMDMMSKVVNKQHDEAMTIFKILK